MNNWKNSTILFVLCLAFSSTATIARASAELIITIKECRVIKGYAYLSELQIMKNGEHYKTLKPEHDNKLILKNLDIGTYSLTYKTIFNKEETFPVNITQNKRYYASICTTYLDYSKETYKPIIDILKEGEAYSICLSSQGCFHSSDDTLIVTRRKNTYSISWGKNSKTLSKKDMRVIRNFEIELTHMAGDGCTTTDTYVVEYKGAKQETKDGSCSWRGGYYLKQQIFGEE
ncbi:MAG: hypothetical protein JNL32_04350 [Candidatus Kapabacteria bacterium]|nr:hypothetical protein [Candidatus Kapabacteria bacterium]